MALRVPPEINVPEPGAPLLVGRDPGRDEVEEGRPFVGSSGRLLFGGWDPVVDRYTPGIVQQAMGFRREDLNITNRVLQKPWNNEFYRHSWDVINQDRKHLMELIEELQPSLIIALGNEACYDLVPDWSTIAAKPDKPYPGGKSIKSAKSITERRGFFWHGDSLPCPVLSTLHPASCLYNPVPHRILLEGDLRRAGAWLRGDLPRLERPPITRVRTKADLAPLWEADITAFDIEVKWGGNAFLCIAFYTSNGDLLLAYEDALGACEDWLRSDCRKLAHNKQFDNYYLKYKMGIEVGGVVEDTIICHWAMYPELAGQEETGRENATSGGMTRKSLNFLASWHLNVPYWKEYTSNVDKMGQLCAMDVFVTMHCWNIMSEEMYELDVVDQYERSRDMVPALVDMQGRGLRVDQDLLSERLSALKKRQETKEAEATEAAESFLKAHHITHKEDGDEYWWYHDARCECCFGGSVARQHCTSCAGIEGSGANGAILKSDLVEWAEMAGHSVEGLSKGDLHDLLPPCSACSGKGTIPDWSFNPMSSLQLQTLLFDHLSVPKKCYHGDEPDATEETIKMVLEWAQDDEPSKTEEL